MLAFRTVTYCTENEETPQRRTEELGRRLVEQEAAVKQLNASNEQLEAKANELLTAKQQLELALTAAKSSVTAQARPRPVGKHLIVDRSSTALCTKLRVAAKLCGKLCRQTLPCGNRVLMVFRLC